MGPGRVLLASGVLFGLYVLLAGSISVNETLAGLGTVGLVSVLILASHRGERRRLAVRPTPLLLPRVASSLLLDALRVGRALWSAILHRPHGRAGGIVAVAFDDDGERPTDAGRRGLVTLAASVAPNGFVLAVPRGRTVLVMHRLASAPIPSDRDWPV